MSTKYTGTQTEKNLEAAFAGESQARNKYTYTVKALQVEYSALLDKKKKAYEDYKRLRQENQELQAVKSNVDSLLNIQKEEHQEKEKNQEQGR